MKKRIRMGLARSTPRCVSLLIAAFAMLVLPIVPAFSLNATWTPVPDIPPQINLASGPGTLLVSVATNGIFAVGDAIKLQQVLFNGVPINFSDDDGYAYLKSMLDTTSSGMQSLNVPLENLELTVEQVGVTNFSTTNCALGVSKCAVAEFPNLDLGVYLVSGSGFESFIVTMPTWDPKVTIAGGWHWEQVAYPKVDVTPDPVPTCANGQTTYDSYFGSGAYARNCEIPDPKYPIIACPNSSGVFEAKQCAFTYTYDWQLAKKVRQHCDATAVCEPWGDEFTSSQANSGDIIQADYRIQITANRNLEAVIPLANPSMFVQSLATLGTSFVAPGYLQLSTGKSGELLFSSNPDGTKTWYFAPHVTIPAATGPSTPGLVGITITKAPNIPLPDNGIAAITVNLGKTQHVITLDLAASNRYNQLWDNFPELANKYSGITSQVVCVIEGVSYSNCLAIDAEKVIENPLTDGIGQFVYTVAFTRSQLESGSVRNTAYLADPAQDFAQVHFVPPLRSSTTQPVNVPKRQLLSRTGTTLVGLLVGSLLASSGVIVARRRRLQTHRGTDGS